MKTSKKIKKGILVIQSILILMSISLITSSCQKKESSSDKVTGNASVIAEGTKAMNFSSDNEIVAQEAIYFASQPLDFLKIEEGKNEWFNESVVTDDHVFLLFSISDNKKSDELYNLAYEKRNEGKNEEAEQIEASIYKETNRDDLIILDKDGNLRSRMDISSIFPEEEEYVRIHPGYQDEILIQLVGTFYESDVENQGYLYCMDSEGNIKGERITIPSLKEDGKTRNYDSFALDDQKNLYAKGDYYSETEYVHVLDVFDPVGNHLFSLQDESTTWEGLLFENLYISNQTIYLMTSEDMEGKQTLCRIDLEKQELVAEAEFSLPSSDLDFRDDMFFFSDVEGIKCVRLDRQIMETFLLWKDVDLLLSEYNQTSLVLSSDKVLVYNPPRIQKRSASDQEWFLLSRTTENPNAGKEIIKIGGYSISQFPDILYTVQEFNRISTDSRAELVDFSAWAEQGGNNDNSSNQVRMSLLSGDIPDILISTQGEFDYINALAQKGFLADLLPLVEGDNSFTKNQYPDMMFTLPKTDGKLFYTFTDYSLSGLLIKKEYLPADGGWTIQGLREQMNSLSDSQQTFTDILPGEFLYRLTQVSLRDFVDFTNKQISFDSGALEEILRFSLEYGCAPEETYGGDGHTNERDKIRDGDLFLGVSNGVVGTPMEWRFLWNEAGSDVTFAGIPTKDGNKVLCNPGKLVAIADGEKKEIAWEFLKILLSQESQQNLTESFPVHQGQLQIFLEEQKNPPDELGKADLLSYQLLTDEAIQEFYEIQIRASALSSVDDEIMEIVISEAQAYFAGQKTLEATVEIIQNRAMTYVNQL